MNAEPVVPTPPFEYFVYCPRQCALIHCDGSIATACVSPGFRVPAFVERGRSLHHAAVDGLRVSPGLAVPAFVERAHR